MQSAPPPARFGRVHCWVEVLLLVLQAPRGPPGPWTVHQHPLTIVHERVCASGPPWDRRTRPDANRPSRAPFGPLAAASA